MSRGKTRKIVRKGKSKVTATAPATAKSSGSKPSRTRATRSTAATVEERVHEIITLLSDGYMRADVVRYAADTWGVAERTTDDYLKRAKEVLAQETADEAGQLVQRLVGVHLRSIRIATEQGRVGDRTRAATALAKLLGLDAAGRAQLARAGLDESLTAALDDPDARAAALLKAALNTTGDDSSNG